jgi:nitric oxide reductase NorD protein
MLLLIRRRFETLRAQRTVLRRQLDGEEIDLDACIDALADVRAGAASPERLYQRLPPAQRDIAAVLLIDVSGSTDGWVSAHRRIIDVEREALLLVCVALQDLGEPYAVQAFSGEGPHNVTVRPLKKFEEQFDDEIALRIAAVEPERYTRAGAAIRHATAQLMRRSAGHRLLMLLSDGKPNDVDHYEGRFGVEDMRQAVLEARTQGIHPFCLTIDRQAPDYVPHVFGAHHYAMLPRSELLPTVLLDWMRRLLSAHRP